MENKSFIFKDGEKEKWLPEGRYEIWRRISGGWLGELEWRAGRQTVLESERTGVLIWQPDRQENKLMSTKINGLIRILY